MRVRVTRAVKQLVGRKVPPPLLLQNCIETRLREDAASRGSAEGIPSLHACGLTSRGLRPEADTCKKVCRRHEGPSGLLSC